MKGFMVGEVVLVEDKNTFSLDVGLVLSAYSSHDSTRYLIKHVDCLSRLIGIPQYAEAWFSEDYLRGSIVKAVQMIRHL